MGLFRVILGFLGGTMKSVGEYLEQHGRVQDQNAGAAMQREADQADELKERDEQLEKAVKHRPDDWRDDAGSGRF